mmetsp:Transcript_58185/g.123404  ORF Transcript_58185/g.123404 Transcript_58185/m.123404 type:complete len:520 (-) Transcript_58185:82-1641(-)
MKLSVALLVSVLSTADADGRSAAARLEKLRRRLSLQEIAGYKPGSSVTDHCALDLDQAAIEKALSAKTPESYAAAEKIYNEGGHSKSYANIELVNGLTSSVKKGDALTGKNSAGNDVSGKFASDYDDGIKSIKVYYTTTDVQEDWVGCRVGALPEPYTEGCFADEGDLIIGGSPHAYTVAPNNKADRTIAGFSTGAADKMRLNCKGCPYDDFQKFYNYYGQDDYADEWISSAFAGTSTSFTNGNADFSKVGYDGKEQAIKKGTAYLSIFMYVIREFEDAIDDCNAKSIDNNYDAVHAMDEGVCFYTGSIEGTDGKSDDGKLLHQLADKRCSNFKTCGELGGTTSGMAKINYEMFQLFELTKYELEKGQCDTAKKGIKQIIQKMYVPMIQGTLRYAYKMDKLQGGEVENAEGATFAAAVLPKVHAVSPDAARIIYENMRLNAGRTDFKAVKGAFESTYEGMGVKCEDVGGLWFDALDKYYEGMEPCDNVAISAQSADSAGSEKSLAAAVFCITLALMVGL